MSTLQVPLVTAEEYLELDRASDVRNEYVCGEIVAMAGGKPRHSRLITNTIAALIRRLRTECGVYEGHLRVCVNRETLYTYPDVTVVCGPLEFRDEKEDTITNPKLIAEVLSPTTRSYALGDKARMYTRIPALSDLLLIDQERVWIEHWRRLPKAHWDVETITDLSATLEVESITSAAPVAEIYQHVDFNGP